MTSLPSHGDTYPASRLVLGTAQLGMPYGIANKTGQPDLKTAKEIIKSAWQSGICEYDTAQAYGESESILGKAMYSLGIANEARVITKLDPRLDPCDKQSIETAILKSIERLCVPSLYGLMLHREEWLSYLNKGLGDILRNCLYRGDVQHLGVSLYAPAKALQVLELDLFDIIHVPANILDHRFADSGVFQLAEKKGKQVYIRSVFLQGLLLMKPDDLLPDMAFTKPVLLDIDLLCKKYGCSRQKLALLYVKETYPQARIIVGAETKSQLLQNLNIWKETFSSSVQISEISRLANNDERIINPSRW